METNPGRYKMSKLNKKEEKALSGLKIFYEKYEWIFYLLIGIGFPLVIILDLFVAFDFKDIDPLKSRDHFWLAAMFGSWGILVLTANSARKKLFLIIQKLKK